MAAPIQPQVGQDIQQLYRLFEEQQAQQAQMQARISELTQGLIAQGGDIEAIRDENERLRVTAGTNSQAVTNYVSIGKMAPKASLMLVGAEEAVIKSPFFKEAAEKATRYAIEKLPVAGHVLGEGTLKAIPVIGVGMGVAAASRRWCLGHHFGMVIGEVASGLASLIPGWGTAASLGIDSALLAADLLNSATKTENVDIQPPVMSLDYAYRLFELDAGNTDADVISICRDTIRFMHENNFAGRAHDGIERGAILARLEQARNVIFQARGIFTGQADGAQGAAAHA
jgi:hypothetical protein